METSPIQILLDGLIETKARTLTYFDLPESQLYYDYGPGKWCIKEILHHLADAETVLYERLRRPMAEHQPVMWGFAQDEWCKQLQYREMPLDLDKQIYTAVRNAIISMASRYYESHGHLPFIHTRMGLRTLKEEYEKVVWHNENHLKQIELALEIANSSNK